MSAQNKKRTGFFPRLGRALLKPGYTAAWLCQRYLDAYNGYSYEFYKNGESDLLLKLSQLKFTTIFDVGSNIGDWALIAQNLFPNATIYCFELSKKTYQTLSTRLSDKHFKLNAIGLADKCGTITYKDYGANAPYNTMSLNTNWFDDLPHQLVEAAVSTGTVYCAENKIEHIDLLKIDAEGVDHLVMKGFSGLLDKKRIRVIQFEYGYAHGDAKFLMRDFYELLEGYGYRVARLCKGPIIFSEWTYPCNDFRSGPNYIAVRADDAELISLLANKKP